MRPKHRMPFAVLACGAYSNTVCKCGLQPIEIRPDHIYALVRRQPRQVLPNTLPHDARLTVIDAESLLLQDRGHMRREALHAALKIVASGECQVVGITRIHRSG